MNKFLFTSVLAVGLIAGTQITAAGKKITKLEQQNRDLQAQLAQQDAELRRLRAQQAPQVQVLAQALEHPQAQALFGQAVEQLPELFADDRNTGKKRNRVEIKAPAPKPVVKRAQIVAPAVDDDSDMQEEDELAAAKNIETMASKLSELIEARLMSDREQEGNNLRSILHRLGEVLGVSKLGLVPLEAHELFQVRENATWKLIQDLEGLVEAAKTVEKVFGRNDDEYETMLGIEDSLIEVFLAIHPAPRVRAAVPLDVRFAARAHSDDDEEDAPMPQRQELDEVQKRQVAELRARMAAAQKPAPKGKPAAKRVPKKAAKESSSEDEEEAPKSKRGAAKKHNR